MFLVLLFSGLVCLIYDGDCFRRRTKRMLRFCWKSQQSDEEQMPLYSSKVKSSVSYENENPSLRNETFAELRRTFASQPIDIPFSSKRRSKKRSPIKITIKKNRSSSWPTTTQSRRKTILKNRTEILNKKAFDPAT